MATGTDTTYRGYSTTPKGILEDLLYVVESLQEHPTRWDAEARMEARSLIDSLFSLAEVVEGSTND